MLNIACHTGSALDILPTLPAGSVQCVVTSPPYWNMRVYGRDAGMIGLEPTWAEHLDNRLQRDAVLIEINPAYMEMARRRIESDAPLFAVDADACPKRERRNGI